jgi:RimJ/RimL family protein N-acetyltransferase
MPSLDQVRMRRATSQDADRLRAWRNDPDSVAQSLSGAEVDAASHAAWLETILSDPACILLIGELSDPAAVGVAVGEAVGMVRLDLGRAAAEVSINLAPQARGRGLSVAMLLAAEASVRKSDTPHLTARIKLDNAASRSAFERAGYRLVSPETDAILVYRKSL